MLQPTKLSQQKLHKVFNINQLIQNLLYNKLASKILINLIKITLMQTISKKITQFKLQLQQ
jgi:hypothetical protein